MHISTPLHLTLVAALFGVAQAQVKPIPDKIPPAVQDTQRLCEPDRVRLTGFLGQRIDANEQNRLLNVDEEELLAGFRQRPGKQAWVGEHVGKWMHAATLA